MSRMTKGRFLKSSCFLWLSYILSLTGQSNPWCNSNCIWLFLIFLAGREFLLNLFPTNFRSCKKTPKLLAQSFSLCDCLSFSLCALQPQLNTWGALCPLSTWLQLGCANELVTQMSRASLASRQQLWSLASTSAKQMAFLHLFPNIHLDLFFRVNTAIIYFSGAAEKGPR